MTTRLDDGHPTLVSFSMSSFAVLKLWEKEVTPPGIDGGGVNDTTTMRNSKWRTRAPKKLITLSEMTYVAAYDPVIYNTVLAMVNKVQQVTLHFPDGSTLTFWGWVDSTKLGRITEGGQPTCEVTVQPSNQNTSEVETDPSYSGS